MFISTCTQFQNNQKSEFQIASPIKHANYKANVEVNTYEANLLISCMSCIGNEAILCLGAG